MHNAVILLKFASIPFTKQNATLDEWRSFWNVPYISNHVEMKQTKDFLTKIAENRPTHVQQNITIPKNGYNEWPWKVWGAEVYHHSKDETFPIY